MIGNQYEVDNRSIVPYCHFLLKVFDDNINIEFCNSVKYIKHRCKYVRKKNKILRCLLSSTKIIQMKSIITSKIDTSTFWRMFSFAVYERYPAVRQFSVHVKNRQRVYFTSELPAEQAMNPRETTLTDFFKTCSNDPIARILYYHQV